MLKMSTAALADTQICSRLHQSFTAVLSMDVYVRQTRSVAAAAVNSGIIFRFGCSLW